MRFPRAAPRSERPRQSKRRLPGAFPLLRQLRPWRPSMRRGRRRQYLRWPGTQACSCRDKSPLDSRDRYLLVGAPNRASHPRHKHEHKAGPDPGAREGRGTSACCQSNTGTPLKGCGAKHSESCWVSWRLVCPGFRGVEISGFSCHGDGVVALELYRREPLETAVTSPPVVPDLEE